MLPIYMLMGDFISQCSTHPHHFDAKFQRLACQGMVTVQVHGVALDLETVEDTLFAVLATALQMAAALGEGSVAATAQLDHTLGALVSPRLHTTNCLTQ